MASHRSRDTNVKAPSEFPGAAKTTSSSSELDQMVRPIGEPALALASRRINSAGKRGLDLALAWPSLVFVLPALASIALAIFLLSGGPVVARRPMVGRRGKPFALVSFSTATLAERGRLARALGRALDAVGLERLPGLFNVVAGQMSLVGPEPLNAAGLSDFGVERRYYLVTRPGLVCPWREARGVRRAAACRDYILNWRLRRDVSILRATLLGGAR
jgi:lipopolysaccharide/colanic/teichoic acid biosynthesis glycosyltransferase